MVEVAKLAAVDPPCDIIPSSLVAIAQRVQTKYLYGRM